MHARHVRLTSRHDCDDVDVLASVLYTRPGVGELFLSTVNAYTNVKYFFDISKIMDFKGFLG